MKPLLLSLCLTFGLFASANAGVIVYEDNFADGNIATNPDIGGGLSQFIAGGGTGFTEAGGDINADTSANNQRAYAFSTNTFDLSDGFILDYTVNLSNTGAASANRFAVGLAEEGSDFSAFTTSGRNFLGTNLFLNEAFGVDLTTDAGQGLNFNNGTGTVTTLDNAQTITANTDLNVVLTVDSVGNYTYSINGATASTGTTTLDLSQEYHFATYYQDDLSSFAISQVSLEALPPSSIPEPSSTALIGLGGLLLLRRKKSC